jgi:hypothetical protein
MSFEYLKLFFVKPMKEIDELRVAMNNMQRVNWFVNIHQMSALL